MIRVVELRNYVEILSGFAFDSNLFNDSHDGIPLIRIRDVGKNFSKTFFAGQYDEKYIVKNGDYLIGMDGDFRLSEWKGVDALLNQRVCKISVTKLNELSEKYLLHFLPKELKLIEDSTSFATVKHLSVEKVKKIQIPLPPLPQQQKIANILDAADALRQNDKALIAKYDELTQALFLDMFGDPVSNPKGWEGKVLNELIIQKPDNGFFAKSNFYTNEGVQIVWLSDFIDRIYIKTSNLKRVLISEKDKKYILEYGDALFCRSSLTVEGIGKCAIVPKKTYEPIIFECHIIRLRLEINTVLPEYFRFLTNTKYFRSEVMKKAKTSTMTTISQEGISCIKIPIPPFDLQNKFAERLAVIEEQKAIAQKSLEKSEELFNSLLQKAFKGELV